MAYNPEEIVQPFWSEFSSTASGRDPLAIQNSSVVIYTKMVVGITNVTNRIRYNGLFCWIFDAILQRIDKKNSIKEQIRYSRRAELLLAYIMVRNFPDITGVSGGAYAAKNLGEVINLKKGADWEFKQQGEKVYWQAKHGVFGQYYSGVTRVLNLINHPNPQLKLNVYTLTEKGIELAQAFAETIPREESDLFWKSVLTGSVLKSELITLKSFALHLITADTKEHELYKNAILTADDRKVEPTFHRRETIQLLLRHLNQNKEGIENPVVSFLRTNYRYHLNELTLKKNTATAWYLFEINELIHVTYEHFHSCFLYFIEIYPTSLENKIEELVKITLEAFNQYDSINNITIDDLSKLLEISEEDIYVAYDEMEKSFRAREFGKCLMYAVKTLVQLQVNCSPQLGLLEEFAVAPENNFNRNGYAIELIDELILSQKELSIKAYVRSLLLKVINLHTFSSYSKTSIGQSLVHNYMMENFEVWRLRETLPNRTSPRLQNVLQYMADIGWVNRNGKVYSITVAGNNIIEGL